VVPKQTPQNQSVSVAFLARVIRGYWCEVGVTRLLSHNTRRKKIVNFVSAKCPEWIDQKSPTVRCGLSDN
jgi:hypothetical protein